MLYLTPLQVADYWIGAGGPKARAVEWVAIAMGESGLAYDARSPADARGLWQIMPFNAAPNGFAVSQLYNPAVNARIAVLMSGGGVNCAAWDSCYADIGRSGRYTFLSWPERGSDDFANLAVAQAELSGHGLKGMTDPGYPGIADTMPAAARAMQAIADSSVPALTGQVARSTRAISASYRGRWRP